MPRSIGVLAREHIAVGLVGEHQVVAPVLVYPGKGDEPDALQGIPADAIGERIREQIEQVGQGQEINVVGVGFPGITREGIIEESPNLQQVKGLNLQAILSSASLKGGAPVPVRIFNDADVMAAGIAATQGQLDRFIRVWTLGNGIGFGRYPWTEGIWEGGHSVVTLDPKEHFCACGGKGHLEGIMGLRAMRLRFWDMEPDEVFTNAKAGDARCGNFVKLWHRALAAATATSIHMDGPGKFFITGPNARFIDLGLMGMYLHEMVKMTPLQGSVFEMITTSDEIGIIGAAVNAERVMSAS
jgi:glucokinase